MAHVKKNKMMEGTSGTIGNVTFSVRKSKTISGPKITPSKKPPTEEQLAVQLKFERCSAYAQKMITDPVKRLLYMKAATGDQSAFNAAFQDAARPPKVADIDTRYYKGRVGDVIVLLVKDVVRVESVKVAILSATGEILEQGDAVHDTGNYWNYKATVANPTLLGTRILITATDLPGNVTEAEGEI